MFKEYLKLKNYVKVPWIYFTAGFIFMFLFGITNGISLSTTVPLMDRIFSQKYIILPKNFPPFLYNNLKEFINSLNRFSPSIILKYLIFFIIFVTFLKGIFFYLQNYFFKFFGMRIITDIRNKIYSKITYLSLDFFTKERSGEITTRIIYDVGMLTTALADQFPQFILKSCESCIYLAIIFMIDWKLSIVSLFIFPLLLGPVFKISKKLRKLGKNIQESYGKLGNLIQENVYTQQIIKAFNQQEKVIKKFEKENENIFSVGMAIIKRMTIITPFTEIMAAVGAGGIIFYGGKKVIEGDFSAGFFTLFLAGLFSLISPLKTIGTMYASLKHSSSALPRIFSILEEEVKVRDTGRKIFKGIKEKIEFKNVSFSYENKKILKNISFTVKKGEKIGIVGPTGVGKTTLIGLLLRFYEPEEGEILIDGENIKEFTLDSLRKNIGLVTQEPILFYDTIEKNISLEEKSDIEKVKKSVASLFISDFIESLPEKYNTIIGERGITLSGGQKQLLTIARAIYKDPTILILDEATSSLDAKLEEVLQAGLEKIIKDRTVFIIAHRLSSLRNIDRIIVLKDSYIVEEGTHQELFDKKGIYYNLWKSQFDNIKK